MPSKIRNLIISELKLISALKISASVNLNKTAKTAMKIPYTKALLHAILADIKALKPTDKAKQSS